MVLSMRFFIVLLFFSLLLLGCTSQPLESRNTSQSIVGAAIGGSAATLGTAALGAPRPLIIGAGIGGIALGYYVTTLRFDAGPIYKVGGNVYAQGDYLCIDIPSYKLFDTHTADLLPQAEPILDSAVAVLKRYPNANIMISGNTGGWGSYRDDQKLSQARAKEIAAYLWAHGINNFKNQSLHFRKLTFVGYGNYFPIANSSKISNVQKNSHIQITAYPSKADLKLDKTITTFNNIGDMADPPAEKL